MIVGASRATGSPRRVPLRHPLSFGGVLGGTKANEDTVAIIKRPEASAQFKQSEPPSRNEQPQLQSLLSVAQAADHLGMSRSWLDKSRMEGSGPRFRKFGRRVLYHITDLEDWTARRAYQSTSELSATRGDKGGGR
jgi:predicted DNA-binding transcriptional regulator AlpA